MIVNNEGSSIMSTEGSPIVSSLRQSKHVRHTENLRHSKCSKHPHNKELLVEGKLLSIGDNLHASLIT